MIGRRADGFHLLDSLFAFADIGDFVTVEPAETLSLTIDGPEAAGLAAAAADNLVLRAARRFAEHAGVTGGARLHLEKRLPVASGIGGGSTDAAAALRGLAVLWDRKLDAGVAALAAELGADLPACLAGVPVWVGGIGEVLEPAVGLPPAGIVLANPRRPLATPAVFRAWQARFSRPARFETMPRDPAALALALASRDNDLTAAAVTIVPEIAAVVEHLAELPGALLARMSGSGATCFALFNDRIDAVAASRVLAAAQPGWWIAAGRLLRGAPEIEPG